MPKRLGVKFAIIGPHGSGKTTIAHEVVAALKRRNYVATLCIDVARHSHFLSSQTHVPEMQLDLFGRQIASETEATRTSLIVLCDRTLLDRAVYADLFFRMGLSASQTELFRAMDRFVPAFMRTYRMLFRTTRIFDPAATSDPLRPLESRLQVCFNTLLLERLKAMHIPHTDLRDDDPVDQIVTTITSIVECHAD